MLYIEMGESLYPAPPIFPFGDRSDKVAKADYLPNVAQSDQKGTSRCQNNHGKGPDSRL
jgi:hypothetical protein